MNLEEYNARVSLLEKESFIVIRRKISDITDESTNDEIAGFVKGVVAAERQVYENLEREFRFSQNKE